MIAKRRAAQRRFLVSAPQMMVLSFAAAIALGTVLLCLPWATSGHGSTGFLDALFTATSAVCVTGLVVVDTGTHFSTFGQIVILLLFQAGGLGIMTFSVLAVVMAGGRVSYRFRMALKESLNRLNVRSVMEVALAIMVLAFVVESAGFLLLWARWGPDMGWGRAAWQALFHSVSGFCNAGFSLNANSLMAWRDDLFVNVVMCLLIIVGGIGFTVIFEVLERKSLRGLTLHSRMALITTAALIAVGAVLIMVFETFKPPYSFEHYGFYDRAITAVFQSVTARTAGFNTVDIGAMSDASVFMLILLMFVGGSPGGTAGGMKTTTFAALLAAGAAIVRGERDVRVFNRRLGHELLLRAFTIALLSMAIVATVTLAMTAIEGRHLMHLLFEVTSAFGTVGLSTGITPDLVPVEKVLIVFTMFVGRLGPLTMAMALGQSIQKKQYRLPPEEIVIG